MRWLLIVLVLASGCEKTRITMEWSVLGQDAAAGCAELRALEDFDPVNVRYYIRPSEGDALQGSFPCADGEGQIKLEGSQTVGTIFASMFLPCPQFVCGANCNCPGFCDPNDDVCKDYQDILPYDVSESSATFSYDFFPPDTPDAGVPDASDPDAGAEDASVDAMPDAGPAGPDKYVCYCNNDGAMTMGCADLPTCVDSTPIPGTLCSDFCATHGGPGANYCFVDHVDCM